MNLQDQGGQELEGEKNQFFVYIKGGSQVQSQVRRDEDQVQGQELEER